LGQKLLSQDIKLKQLKLDNNNIGTEGLGFLAIGLRQIKTLDKLSLKYCNIDSNGSKYLQ
jgi:Ran GTPase-activating protein (RanGAP) involved in mRNA processing and transport